MGSKQSVLLNEIGMKVMRSLICVESFLIMRNARRLNKYKPCGKRNGVGNFRLDMHYFHSGSEYVDGDYGGHCVYLDLDLSDVDEPCE